MGELRNYLQQDENLSKQNFGLKKINEKLLQTNSDIKQKSEANANEMEHLKQT